MAVESQLLEGMRETGTGGAGAVVVLRLTAVVSGQLANFTDLGGRLGLNRVTAKKYLALLEQLFLVERVPAWHAAEFTRLVRTPKLHGADTGMMCAVRGIGRRSLVRSPAELGSLLESFAYNELRKQALWVDEPLAFHHHRDKDKVEGGRRDGERVGRMLRDRRSPDLPGSPRP